MTAIGLPFAVTPMNPRVDIFCVEPNLTVGRLYAARVHELCEMRVGHFSSVDKKLADINLPMRPLIIGAVDTAHQKYTRCDSNHSALVLISGPREPWQLYK